MGTTMIRCNHCQLPCDNNAYKLGQFKAKDTYMGRRDEHATIYTYYCSGICQEHMYIQYTTNNMIKTRSYLKNAIHALLQRKHITDYPVCFNNNPIPIVTAYLAYLRLLEACLAHTFDITELYSLQYNAKTKMGDVLETHHTVEKAMNILCFKLRSIQIINVHLFAKK